MPTFVELWRRLTDPNPRQARLREQFKDFILNDVLAGMKARIEAVERELDRREREIRRARLTVIEGGTRGGSEARAWRITRGEDQWDDDDAFETHRDALEEALQGANEAIDEPGDIVSESEVLKQIEQHVMAAPALLDKLTAR
jgi:hypothetical protein